MFSEQELRNRIAQVIVGNVSLDDFEDWFVGASWNVHAQADPRLAQLVGAVELHLAEYSSGHRDERQLRSGLKRLLFPSQFVSCNASAVDAVVVHHVPTYFSGEASRVASNVVNSIPSVAPSNVNQDEPDYEFSGN